MSTHNLCFGAKIRKNVYLCKPQFFYIKGGCKGVYITRTCLHDGEDCAWPIITAIKQHLEIFSKY